MVRYKPGSTLVLLSILLGLFGCSSSSSEQTSDLVARLRVEGLPARGGGV